MTLCDKCPSELKWLFQTRCSKTSKAVRASFFHHDLSTSFSFLNLFTCIYLLCVYEREKEDSTVSHGTHRKSQTTICRGQFSLSTVGSEDPTQVIRLTPKASLALLFSLFKFSIVVVIMIVVIVITFILQQVSSSRLCR